MADVKIIDIDSEQWNMKDQAARDRLDIVENDITQLNNNIQGGILLVVQEIGLAGSNTRVRGFAININKRTNPTKIFQSNGTSVTMASCTISAFGTPSGVIIYLSGDVRNQYPIGSMHILY